MQFAKSHENFGKSSNSKQPFKRDSFQIYLHSNITTFCKIKQNKSIPVILSSMWFKRTTITSQFHFKIQSNPVSQYRFPTPIIISIKGNSLIDNKFNFIPTGFHETGWCLHSKPRHLRFPGRAVCCLPQFPTDIKRAGKKKRCNAATSNTYPCISAPLQTLEGKRFIVAPVVVPGPSHGCLGHARPDEHHDVFGNVLRGIVWRPKGCGPTERKSVGVRWLEIRKTCIRDLNEINW